MKKFSTAMIFFFILCFANIFLFVAFQFFVSKKFVLVDHSDFSRVLAATPPSQSQGSTILGNVQDIQNQLVTTIQEGKDSVVSIIISKNLQFFQDPFGINGQPRIAERKEAIGGGSGIIIRKDGLIITNKHVVSDLEAEYSVILNNGESYEVANIWRDPVVDIAIIQLQTNGVQDFSVAQFIDFATPVTIGQFVVAIGNALAEYQNSVTFGILSAKNRILDSYDADSLYIGLYQTDTSINPGNSGGPLFDIDGRVIGINTAINANGAGIGFALPVTREFIEASIALIDTYNYLERPFIGIQYKDLSSLDLRQLGLEVQAGSLVEDIVSGSAAEQYGLQPGDIITAIDGNAILEDIPFMYHIYQHVPGDTVVLSVIRDKKPQTISLVLGKK